MKKAEIIIDRNYILSEIDPNIYGSFLEHLGRAIYTGIYDPGNHMSDENGFRRDVLDAIKTINVPIVRYPGGNFVSGYNWEDGIGPRDKRPCRSEPAWNSIETNQFGLDEFMDWCKVADTQPLMAVNLGTRGPEAARDIVEYCNYPAGTYWSDLRIKNGHPQPHDIKLWCLGNEMDGPWQIGHKTASEYARVAHESAKLMKMIDPSIKLIACGSSTHGMKTFGEWEATVLDECFDIVDYISMHVYYSNHDNEPPIEYLNRANDMDSYIKGVVSACDYVAAKKHSKKKIMISFDEWNVWYHSGAKDRLCKPRSFAPPLCEEDYDFADALLVGSMLITLLRHADRVKIACLAQLVNVIAPITATEKGVLLHTTYYPYMHASRYGRGTVLNAIVKAPQCESKHYGQVDMLDAVVIENSPEEVTIMAVNKDTEEDMSVTVDLRQYGDMEIVRSIEMTYDDLTAGNTFDDPDRITPKATDRHSFDGGVLTANFGKHSWNVITLKTK